MSPEARLMAGASGGPDLRGRRVVVVGLAASGLAATEALARRGASVLVTEARPRARLETAARRAEAAGAETALGGHAPEHLEGAELVVTSPGVPERAEILRWATERGIPVWSEVELGARLADAPYLAVTGTNGKTTTTEMIAAIFRAAGRDVVACGNAGHPFSTAADEGHEALAVEVSSFQLRFHESLHPRVSVLLNLAPDHLDWHGGYEAYRAAKARIYAYQGTGDVHVGNRDDDEAAAVSGAAPCDIVWTTLAEPREGEVGYVDGSMVSRLDAERTLGRLRTDAPGFLADAAAAAAAALAFGADPEAASRALASFAPLPHRGAVVAEVSGVRFVDDSKATNPHAALESIRAFDRCVLIAGGQSKGVDLTPLVAEARRLRGVVVIGEAADELVRVLGDHASVTRADSIEEAVTAGFEMRGEATTVLLAPACASFDMFRDYRERGDRFAAAARALTEGRG